MSSLGARALAGLRAALAYTLIILLPATARAQSNRPVVSAAMSDGSALEPELLATLRELGDRIGVQVQDAAFAGASWAALRFTRTADGATDIRLSGGEQPTSERHVLAAESPALERETVAHVTLAMIETRLDAERPAAPAPVTEPPEPEPEPKKPSPPVAFRADAQGAAAWLARHEPAARIEGAIGAIANRRLQPSVSLSLGATFLPLTRTRDYEARMSLLSMRVRSSVVVQSNSRAALEVGFPIGIDVARAALRDSRRIGARTRHELGVQPVVGARISGHVRVARSVAVTFGVGVDVDPMGRRFHVGVPDRPITALTLAHARPYLTAGFAWGAFFPTR